MLVTALAGGFGAVLGVPLAIGCVAPSCSPAIGGSIRPNRPVRPNGRALLSGPTLNQHVNVRRHDQPD